GDIARVGYRVPGVNGVPITLEAKNTSSINLTSAMREAETEAANYLEKWGGHHPFPVVMHKRHGVAAPERQWVTMTAEQFTRLLRVAEGVDTEPFGEQSSHYQAKPNRKDSGMDESRDLHADLDQIRDREGRA